MEISPIYHNSRPEGELPAQETAAFDFLDSLGIDYERVTHELADTFILVLCVTLVGSADEYPVSAGIIQGGGDTRYAFWVDTLFMWCFTLPFSALSAFVWGFPPLVTFLFLKADQILKCIPNFIKCNRYKWVRELTR